MAVSNSTDFTQTAQELIVDALAELGVLAEEEPLEATDLNRGLRIMTRMLKAWQADGVMAWTMTAGTLALVQGQASYAFGSGGDFTTVPLDIGDMEINRGSNDLPMNRLSREEYRALPNKTTQGYPTQFYYDRQRTGGTLYVWPAPDATAGTLKFTYRRIIMDMDAGANNIDLPQEWHDAIVYGLAYRLVGPYSMDGKPTAARLKAEAERSYQVVKNFDVGEGKGSLSVTSA
jgi:hypothetical protein